MEAALDASANTVARARERAEEGVLDVLLEHLGHSKDLGDGLLLRGGRAGKVVVIVVAPAGRRWRAELEHGHLDARRDLLDGVLVEGTR